MLRYVYIHISYASVPSEIMTTQASYTKSIPRFSDCPVFNMELYSLYSS